jgi:drug/metabolite transporter (DMT)-like permease
VAPLLRRRAVAVVAALAILYLVWGSTYLGIALALETLPPLLMASARFLVAGALLYAVARRVTGSAVIAPDRRQWLAALVTGAFLFGAGNGGVALGQQTVPSGIAALVIASIPLWIALVDRVFFGQRLRPATLAGIAVGFVGVVLLVGPVGSSIDPLGGIFLVAAALGWALGTLLSRGTQLTVPPLVGAGMQMLCGGAVLAVAGIAAGELGRVDLGGVSLRSAGAFAYLVVFGSLVAFSAYAWLLRNAATSLVATYAYVNPVVAVFLGWLVLGEAVTGRTLLAGLVILASVALIVSGRPVPQPAPTGPSERDPRRSEARSRAAAALRGR